MADVPERAGLGRPAVVAIGFAVVALVTSLVAVVVVARRSSAPAASSAKAPAPLERTIDASEIMKLKRDVVEKVVDGKGTAGVTIKDDGVRAALGLEPGDIITALNGRALKREFDVYDAVLGMSLMDASIAYVEVVRAGQPVLVRWKLEGDLRAARRDPTVRAPLGTGPSSPPVNPFMATPDPLVDSIRRLDALHYEVPRSTVDRLLANPDVYARQARIVPSIRNGQPDGFKVYAIRPGSLWSAIGLANGDTIRAINGHDLSTPDKLLEVYAKLKDATELEISVVRRMATEETIAITIK